MFPGPGTQQMFHNASNMSFYGNQNFSLVNGTQINNDNRFYGTQNINDGPGPQNNYSGQGQSINHGGDQNVNNADGNFNVNHTRTTPPVSPPGQNPYRRNAATTPRQDGQGFDDDVWLHPSLFNRPAPSKSLTLVQKFRNTIRNRDQLDGLLKYRGDAAERVLGDMQTASYSPECEPSLKYFLLNAMIRLSGTSGRSVQCHHNRDLRKIGHGPFRSTGGFVDLWRGKGAGDGQQVVALKVVKPEIFEEVMEKLQTNCRETFKWRALNHLNIVPFLGNFQFGQNPVQICFVSPWIENGDLINYLQRYQTGWSEKFSFAWDVANGLKYLHSLDMVHGNLKGANILITINSQGVPVACITDVGLALVLNSLDVRSPWCAPEVLTHGPSAITEKSDVYAYGCVCYEIFVQETPFDNLRSVEALYKTVVVQRQHPKRPEIDGPVPWRLMEWCWHSNPASRPTTLDMIKSLEEAVGLFPEHSSTDADDPYS